MKIEEVVKKVVRCSDCILGCEEEIEFDQDDYLDDIVYTLDLNSWEEFDGEWYCPDCALEKLEELNAKQSFNLTSIDMDELTDKVVDQLDMAKLVEGIMEAFQEQVAKALKEAE